ncbi:hypothetical protein [Rheinheimera maricola]|uniref:Outer membrane protein beta-barrel domain-containing protein n=1 Tax=Rheinheimera maricola TaxID=2793282 RepID=A0ABS7XDM1_9GAMM|nr:hypothetical protein [Rheinheimera maricola]MBZ9613431.1 hypothetical protein [Rheinheimera maricola]
MNNKLWFAGACLTSVFTSTVCAEDVAIIPRAEAGFSSYSLKFDGIVPLDASGNALQVSSQLGDNVFIYRGGLTIAYADFYLDILGSVSSDFSDIQLIPEFDALEKWTGDREEINITVGYQLFESGSVFAGYRSGELKADGQLNSNFAFKSDGFYVGANYGIPVTDTGVISFNIAYALLDASLSETLFGSMLPSADGDGNGLKYGVAWQAFLSDTVRYSISIDQYRYQTDLASNAGIDVKMTEKESAIRLGVSRVF